jgi:hypothetical protein
MRTEVQLSPPTASVPPESAAAEAASDQDSANVKVRHLSTEDTYTAVGMAVGYVRRCLTECFSLPAHAVATVCGQYVGPDHILAAGDELIFSVEVGHKEVGAHVWTKEQLCEFFQITPEELDIWIAQGLKVTASPVRITETAMDDFVRGQKVPSSCPNNEEATRAVASMANDLKRIADQLDPPPPDVVDTTYVAEKLGLTTKRIAQMALAGEIPSHCIVPGTGYGTFWKFLRSKIEPWIEARPRRRHLTTK